MVMKELRRKLEVMKHLENKDYESIQKMMKEINDELQEKVNDLESLNETLLMEERETNDELVTRSS